MCTEAPSRRHGYLSLQAMVCFAGGPVVERQDFALA